jgi:hypothetical protein
VGCIAKRKGTVEKAKNAEEFAVGTPGFTARESDE